MSKKGRLWLPSDPSAKGGVRHPGHKEVPLIPLLDKWGFLVIEILIASLILTTSIAATMYLFRVGFKELQHAKESNMVASKLPVAIDYLKTSEMKGITSTVELGDGVSMIWKSQLLSESAPTVSVNSAGLYEIYMYKIVFTLTFEKLTRDYEIMLFKHRPKGSAEPAI
ncbi:MAG: hypothetical protein HQL06_15285 [Nitrospirae bacterium]|nr:hypothetical protein [Nitrospirota bacterium]